MGRTTTTPPRETNKLNNDHCCVLTNCGWAITIVSAAAAVRESNAAGSLIVTSMDAGSIGARARAIQSPAGRRSIAPLVSNVRRSTTTARNRSTGARMIAWESSTGCASTEIDATTARRSAAAGSLGLSESMTTTGRSRSPEPNSTVRSTGEVSVGPVTRTVVRSGPSPRSRATTTRRTVGDPGPAPATRSISRAVMRMLLPSARGSVVARTMIGASALPTFWSGANSPTNPARNALQINTSCVVPADSSCAMMAVAVSSAAARSPVLSVAAIPASRCAAPRWSSDAASRPETAT